MVESFASRDFALYTLSFDANFNSDPPIRQVLIDIRLYSGYGGVDASPTSTSHDSRVVSTRRACLATDLHTLRRNVISLIYTFHQQSVTNGTSERARAPPSLSLRSSLLDDAQASSSTNVRYEEATGRVTSVNTKTELRAQGARGRMQFRINRVWLSRPFQRTAVTRRQR